MRKICNKCGFQQDEFLNLGGKKYCKSCNSIINNKYEQQQTQITVSAYEMQAIRQTFRNTLEWFEKYVEKTGYYSDWEQRKQIRDNEIQRKDINSIDLKEIKNLFSTMLFGLRHMIRTKPPFITERLGEDFYKWFDRSGININNCPDELVQCLVDISEVLEGKGERFAKERIRQADENIEKMSKEEKIKKIKEAVIDYQEPLENEEKKAKSLEGRTYRDINFKNDFDGDAEQGKITFQQVVEKIKGQQKPTRAGYLVDDEMETDEFASSSSPVGGFNWNNPQQTFSAQTINWDLIIDIIENKNDWGVKSIVVSHNYVAGRWYQGQPELVLIHRTAKVEYNQANGDLIIHPGKIYKVKDFNDGERAELEQFFVGGFQTTAANSVGRDQKTSFYQSKLAECEASQKGKKDNKGVGKGGVITIIGIVSAVAITGMVIAGKRFSK